MDRCLWFGAVNVIVATLLFAGCGNSESPAAPAASAPTALQNFQLSGAVVDPVNRPVNGARVEVIDGPRAGTVATTGQDGRFSMPGTFTGNITLIATKEGYESESRPVLPPGPLHPGNVTWLEVYFHLEPHGAAADVAGVYTLTLTADRACTDLPAEARTRTYAATVPGGAGSSVIGTVSGGRFLQTPPMACAAVGWCSYDRIRISTVGNYASVFVGIVEQLGEANYLAITLGAEGVFGPNGMAAPSSGVFLYCPGSPPYQVDQGVWGCRETGAVECGAYDRHQLTITRR